MIMTAWSRCFGGSKYSLLSCQLPLSRTCFDLVRPKTGARDSGLGTRGQPFFFTEGGSWKTTPRVSFSF
jgi:hypothetical protein